MSKWLHLLQAMRKGCIVADPAAWKDKQILVSAVAGIAASIYAFLKAMGWINVEIATADLMELGTAIGGALFMGYNIISTVASTKKVGLPGIGIVAPVGVLQPPEPAPPCEVQSDPDSDARGREGNSRNPFLES